jgi:hypothetical protein
VVAVSHPVTDDLVEFLTGTITDAIIAPAMRQTPVAKLSRNRGGRFLILPV